MTVFYNKFFYLAMGNNANKDRMCSTVNVLILATLKKQFDR